MLTRVRTAAILSARHQLEHGEGDLAFALIRLEALADDSAIPDDVRPCAQAAADRLRRALVNIRLAMNDAGPLFMLADLAAVHHEQYPEPAGLRDEEFPGGVT